MRILTKFVVLFLSLPVLAEDQRVITTLEHSRVRVQPTSVRGRLAPQGHFSYLVSLKRSFQRVSKTKYLWSNYCGGSIIQPMKVLTAAHCFDLKNYYYYNNFNLLRVVAGSIINNIAHSGLTSDVDGQQWRQIIDVQLHKEFHFPMNDIAIVLVDAPFNYTRIISYVNPARSETDYEGKCYTAGFGQVGLTKKEKVSKSLLWAEIRILSREKCSAIWGMNMDQFLCSDTVVSDISGGDSGGPLVCAVNMRRKGKLLKGDDNYILVGVASGRNSDKTRLYTRVSAYNTWIDVPLRSSTCNCCKGNIVLILIIKFACLCFDCSFLLS